MIKVPKITMVAGGAATLNSAEFMLDNYKTLAFLFENAAGVKTTVKVKGNTEGGAAEFVPFLLKAVEAADFEEIGAEGKEITETGAFLALISDRMFSHNEYDRAALSLSADTGTIATVYAIQYAPRYFV